jgi:hypothetical protein
MQEKETKGPELHFSVKFSFGRYLYYPVNKIAKDALKILGAGRKLNSFTRDQVKFLKSLGVKVRVVAAEGERLESVEDD